MGVHLPNSAFLGNIDSFFRSFDVSNPTELEITANKKWTSVHTVILSMIGAIGLELGGKNVTCEKLQAASKHYFERMGLFNFLGWNRI